MDDLGLQPDPNPPPSDVQVGPNARAKPERPAENERIRFSASRPPQSLKVLWISLAVAGVILAGFLLWTYVAALPPRPVAVLKDSDRVEYLAFSPDGATLVGGGRQTLKVWDVKTGSQRQAVSLQPFDRGYAIAYSPDGSSLAVACGCDKPKSSGCGDAVGEVRIYDSSTWQLKMTLRHQFGASAVAFSPDGKWLATAGGQWPSGPGAVEGEAYLWDARTWKKATIFKGLSARVVALAFSPDGGTLAVGNGIDKTKRKRGGPYPGVVNLYAVSEPAPRRTMTVQNAAAESLAYWPDGSLIVRASGQFGSLEFWNPDTGDRLSAPKFGDGSPLETAVGIAVEGDRLAISSRKGDSDAPFGRVTVWDLGAEKQTAEWQFRRGRSEALAISQDGRLLATGSAQEVKLWALPKR